MEIILKTNELSKNYSKVNALTNLSFEVRKGMVFGILGPNGSGKRPHLE
jgi:ABC-2 type transport system ATP-binding protein